MKWITQSASYSNAGNFNFINFRFWFIQFASLRQTIRKLNWIRKLIEMKPAWNGLMAVNEMAALIDSGFIDLISNWRHSV